MDLDYYFNLIKLNEEQKKDGAYKGKVINEVKLFIFSNSTNNRHLVSSKNKRMKDFLIEFFMEFSLYGTVVEYLKKTDDIYFIFNAEILNKYIKEFKRDENVKTILLTNYVNILMNLNFKLDSVEILGELFGESLLFEFEKNLNTIYDEFKNEDDINNYGIYWNKYKNCLKQFNIYVSIKKFEKFRKIYNNYDNIFTNIIQENFFNSLDFKETKIVIDLAEAIDYLNDVDNLNSNLNYITHKYRHLYGNLDIKNDKYILKSLNNPTKKLSLHCQSVLVQDRKENIINHLIGFEYINEFISDIKEYTIIYKILEKVDFSTIEKVFIEKIKKLLNLTDEKNIEYIITRNFIKNLKKFLDFENLNSTEKYKVMLSFCIFFEMFIKKYYYKVYKNLYNLSESEVNKKTLGEIFLDFSKIHVDDNLTILTPKFINIYKFVFTGLYVGDKEMFEHKKGYKIRNIITHNYYSNENNVDSIMEYEYFYLVLHLILIVINDMDIRFSNGGI